jgi:hypothetical protein
MTDKQKKSKIGNLLSELRKSEIIYNNVTFSNPEWSLKK